MHETAARGRAGSPSRRGVGDLDARLEPLQRGVGNLLDVRRSTVQSALLSIRIHLDAEFRGDDDLGSEQCQRFAHDDLLPWKLMGHYFAHRKKQGVWPGSMIRCARPRASKPEKKPQPLRFLDTQECANKWES